MLVKSTTTRCSRGGRHQWVSSGGCVENPGCFDNGNGGMVYVQECRKCGATRSRGSDYTGCRPGNNFPWTYTWND